MYCMVPGQRLTVTAPPEVVTLFTDAPTSETRWMQERPDPVVALGRDKMNVHMTAQTTTVAHKTNSDLPTDLFSA